ncbi:hypothetical protein BGW80DRAFT_850048 [Lactifluus volemus]|nr:hypothetical protein BGW80DRAFT_850048 [Lactifluus volemus]
MSPPWVIMVPQTRQDRRVSPRNLNPQLTAHSIWTEKPYKCCLFCGRGFSSQNAVTRHFDDIHSEPKQCHQPGCQKMIIGKRKLVAHLKRVHGHSRKPGKKGLNVLRRAQASSREA